MWLFCNTQWRASAFNLIGLDYPAVIQIAQIKGVTVDELFLDKLKVLELYELQRSRQKEATNDE